MEKVIAFSIFYGVIVAFVYFIYQAAILPGIREMLRFEVFKLRDELRTLVIEGVANEQDKAVALLEEHLNFMLSNLPRFDIYGAIRALHAGDPEKKKRVEAYTERLANAPKEVQAIYAKSLKTFIKALAFNSLFLFAVITVFIVILTLCQVGASKLAAAVRARAHQDAEFAFFSCSEAVV